MEDKLIVNPSLWFEVVHWESDLIISAAICESSSLEEAFFLLFHKAGKRFVGWTHTYSLPQIASIILEEAFAF